jgi:sulfur carrier protein ThiS
MTGNGKPADEVQKNVEVRVCGSPKRLLPGGDTAIVAFIEGETVNALLKRLNIPDEDVWLTVVNDVVVGGDYVLSPGDKVGIMSPVSGG